MHLGVEHRRVLPPQLLNELYNLQNILQRWGRADLVAEIGLEDVREAVPGLLDDHGERLLDQRALSLNFAPVLVHVHDDGGEAKAQKQPHEHLYYNLRRGVVYRYTVHHEPTVFKETHQKDNVTGSARPAHLDPQRWHAAHCGQKPRERSNNVSFVILKSICDGVEQYRRDQHIPNPLVRFERVIRCMCDKESHHMDNNISDLNSVQVPHAKQRHEPHHEQNVQDKRNNFLFAHVGALALDEARRVPPLHQRRRDVHVVQNCICIHCGATASAQRGVTRAVVFSCCRKQRAFSLWDAAALPRQPSATAKTTYRGRGLHAEIRDAHYVRVGLCDLALVAVAHGRRRRADRATQ
eukprot:PhM_4_TR11185/c0_g1_i1/m.13780